MQDKALRPIGPGPPPAPLKRLGPEGHRAAPPHATSTGGNGLTPKTPLKRPSGRGQAPPGGVAGAPWPKAPSPAGYGIPPRPHPESLGVRPPLGGEALRPYGLRAEGLRSGLTK